MIPAVAYLRMSSDRQETSIADQRAAVEKYAKKHGYRILHWYIDEGVSGWKSDQRRGFSKMIAAAERGEFKAVLCWDQDRFSRFPVLEFNHYAYLLTKAGVHIATVAQGRLDFESLTGWLLASMTQVGKDQYVRDLSRNTTRGKITAAMRGDWICGTPPLGYAVVEKRLVVDPATAPIVRSIFREYLAGRSLTGVAEWLNSQGPSPLGKRWSPQVVMHILRNEAYLGRYVWNRERHGKYHSARNGDAVPASGKRGARNDESDWVVIEGNHEPIIGAREFAAVEKQLAIRRRRTTPHRADGGFALTGVLRCGKCGSPMHGRKMESGRIFYLCAASIRDRSCGNSVKQDEVMAHVATELRKRLDPAAVRRLKAEMRKAVRADSAPNQVDGLRRHLAAVEAKLAKATRRLVEVDADLVADVQAHVRRLKEERDALAEQVARQSKPAKEQISDGEERIDAGAALVRSLVELLDTGDSREIRHLLSECMDAIHVWSRPVRQGRRLRYELERIRLVFSAETATEL